MVRTQISLPEELMARARERADRDGISLAELVRQSLTALLADDHDRRRRSLARDATGGYRSGRSDISEQHDAALAEPDW